MNYEANSLLMKHCNCWKTFYTTHAKMSKQLYQQSQQAKEQNLQQQINNMNNYSGF